MTTAARSLASSPSSVVAGRAASASITRSSLLLSAASAVVGLLSYACGLAMTHLLPPREYGDFAASQTLLLIVGTVASSLVPLPLAHRVRATAPGSPERRRALSFSLQMSVVAGAAAAVVAGTVTLGFAGPGVATAVAVSAMTIVGVAPVWGWLQGEGRFGRYAVATVAEVALRVLVSVVVVRAGWGAGGAVASFAVGALLIVLCGPLWFRRDLGWWSGALLDAARWRETGGIALTQLVLSVLVGSDVLVVAYSGDTSAEAVGFQALTTLAKGPVYVAVGTVLVLFPILRSGGADAMPALRRALGTYGRIALLAAVVIATVPPAVAALVLPSPYLRALPETPWLALAGLGYGLFMVLVMVLLALRRRARSLLALAVGATTIATGMLAGHTLEGVHGLAVGAAAGSLAAAAAAALAAHPSLPAGLAPAAVGPLCLAAAGTGVLAVARPLAPLWLGGCVVLAVVTLRHLRGKRNHPGGPGEAEPGRRLRILHLGFEDPAMPGAGGGALRTHETGRRLARSHDVTVLVQRYPSCASRVQDGVLYEHIGFGAGRTRLTRVLGYMLGLPAAVGRRRADVVIEDFFAPVSSIGAPLWTGVPTIGVVQWLNAREKAAQFKVPVHLVERFGVRRHSRLVAVSAGIRDQLLAINPKLDIEVIGNGVAPEAFTVTPRPGAGVVFVGRLEIAQKGLDLLLEAWSLASRQIEGPLVLAGTGPDEQQLRELADGLALGDRVRFAGWMSGQDKYELMASARVVAMPSRYEAFGIVAVEAAATGTPVVAFDIDCLREVVPTACGVLVRPFDVLAYARALVEVHDDLAGALTGLDDRRTFARRHDWDAVAARHERFVVDAATERTTPGARP